jgi:hypothetical protein
VSQHQLHLLGSKEPTWTRVTSVTESQE